MKEQSILDLKTRSKSIDELLELVELARETVDELWQCTIQPMYQEGRMRNTLRIITEHLVALTQEKLSKNDIMATPLVQIKEDMKIAIQSLENWLLALDFLTTKLWNNTDKHQWKGGAYDAFNCAAMVGRLKQVRIFFFPRF